MKIFNLIKKTTNNLRNPQAPKSDLSVAEILFLEYLSNHDTDITTFSKKWAYNYKLDYKKTIAALIKNGYIQIGTAEESLALNKVSDLKLFLKSKGLSYAGSKEILINRILTETTGYDTYFPKRIYILTSKGTMTIEKFKEKRISALKTKISDTITYIRNNNYEQLVLMYETAADSQIPISIGYDKESIIKDVKSINRYCDMGHNTERQLTIAIMTTMFHLTNKSLKEDLLSIGYENVQDSEIFTISAAIRTFRTVLDFNEGGIKKYSIDTCGDNRVCEKCQALQGRTFSISEVKIGENAPPLCDLCRCRMKPIFDFK